jgi:glutathione synthase/RimK-type ligase-like ATP-grasp enzyme
MLVGIHKDPFGQFCTFLQVYEQILSFNGIDSVRLEASEPGFWEMVSKLNLFIFRWRQFDDQHYKAKTILQILENEMGIKCYPNSATRWHYDDKIRQYYLLKQNGFPIVESWIFWDRKLALQWIEGASFPVIFKLKGGAGSSNVILVRRQRHARKLINRMFGKGIISGNLPGFFSTTRSLDFNIWHTIRHCGGDAVRMVRGESTAPWLVEKNYVLFQKFLMNNDFDTRVTVIGDRAFAFRRFNRRDDFRASGSGKLDLSPESVDPKAVRLAFDVSKKMGFQSMAYDVLYDIRGDLQILEISYTYVAEVIAQCPGYWDAELNWHPGHYWPQYFQLMDALNLPQLKQPEICYD